jgi:hypothetical protein
MSMLEFRKWRQTKEGYKEYLWHLQHWAIADEEREANKEVYQQEALDERAKEEGWSGGHTDPEDSCIFEPEAD